MSEPRTGGSAPVEHRYVAVDRTLVMINGASSVLARLLNLFVLAFLYKYLLARVPAEEFALYPIVMSVMVVAPFFFAFFTGGVSRYIVAASARNDQAQVVEIVSSITPLMAAAAGLFVTGGLVLAEFSGPLLAVPAAFEPQAQLMLSLLVLSFAVQMIALPFGVGFQVRQRFVEWNALGLARDVLRLLFLLVLLSVLGPSVLWVVVATVAADMLHLAVVTVRSVSLVPALRLSRRAVRWATARTLVSFGLWTTLGRLAQVFYISAGTLILARFGSAVDVVNYYFAAALFQQLMGLLSFARQPLQPSLVAMHELADAVRLRRAARRGTVYALWAAMFVALPLAILSQHIATLLLEPAYADAALVLVLLMAIFPFSQPSGLLPMLAIATGEVRAFNVAALVSTIMVTVAALGAVTVGQGGAVGVAAALFAVTAAAQVAYFWPMYLRLSGVGFGAFARDIGRGLAPGVAGAIIWAAGAAYGGSGWIGLLTAAGAGAAIYLVVVLLCLDAADRATLHSARERILRSGRRPLPA